MAKHRRAKNGGTDSPRTRPSTSKHRRRGTTSLILLSTTAAGLSTALVFGQAVNNTADTSQVQLANVAFGVGGRGDPVSGNIPNKLNGTVVPSGYQYQGVNYPAGFDIDNSVTTGVPVLHDLVIGAATDPANPNQKIVVVGYSEGALVADRVKRGLATDPQAPPPADLSFVLIASANLPNGGIFARFPDLNIPFFVKSNGAAEVSDFDTTYVTNEYDPYADFPAYFNPLALANTIVAIQYVHPDQYYDSVDYNPYTGTGTTPVLIKVVPHPGAGTDTYVFVPAEHLPLFAPLRQIFGAVGLTPLTEPLLGAIEPLVRIGVDMAYTDRSNLNPEVPTTFSLITPPEKILGAVTAVPGAIGQGVNNAVSTPSPLVAPVSPPSITAKSTPPTEQKLAITDTPPTPPAPSKPPATTSSPLSNTPPLGDKPLTLKKWPTINKLLGAGATTTSAGSGTSSSQTPGGATPPSTPVSETAPNNPAATANAPSQAQSGTAA
ncbi:MAG: hypothetical protein QOH57_5081 [Mycobacterium sp.]|nr:hypothetical protein [Mycobacterium sp.]